MKRYVHYSSTGKKFYICRDSRGRFLDIQSYKRAMGQDLHKRSKAELAKKKKGGKRK